MKKIFLIISLTVTLAFLSCSSDDDATKSNCESCTTQGVNVEFCPDGEGGYDVTVGKVTETFSAEDMEALDLDLTELKALFCADDPS